GGEELPPLERLLTGERRRARLLPLVESVSVAILACVEPLGEGARHAGLRMAQQAANELTVGVHGDARHIAVFGRHALLRALPRRIRGEYLAPWIAVVHRLEEAVHVDDRADEPVRERRSVGVLLGRR